MNIEIANAMAGYLETLYKLNQKIIKLCGSNVYFDDFANNKKEILDIIQDIPRLIPYYFNGHTKKLEFDLNDGLLEYNNEIPYLLEEYQKILESNYQFLVKVKQIRNKYEHKMHSIKHTSSSTGTLCLFQFQFKINKNIVVVSAGEFINLLKQLNILFSKIVSEISQYVYQNGKDDYPYYNRLTRFDFTEFNLIYESKLLHNIGKIMQDF